MIQIKKENVKVILAIIFLLIIHVYGHELTHKQIFEYYGCDSEIIMFPEPKTIAVGKCNMSYSLLEAQSNVDAIGYPLTFIYIILVLIFISKYIE